MFPKTHITIAAAATVIVTATVLMSPSSNVEAKRMSYSLDLEQGIVAKTNAEPEPSAQPVSPSVDKQPSSPATDSTELPSLQVSLTEPAVPAAPEQPQLDWHTCATHSAPAPPTPSTQFCLPNRPSTGSQ